MTVAVGEATQILVALEAGDRSQVDRLAQLVYEELRKVAGRHMHRERDDHTLTPTALVHEAFLKLVDQRSVRWQGRAHFVAVASGLMRRILVDHARGRLRAKRGGAATRVVLDESVALSPARDADVLAVHQALDRLAALDATQATMAEMRFFGGLSVEEVAEVMGSSRRSVERQWTLIRAWLRRELAEDAA